MSYGQPTIVHSKTIATSDSDCTLFEGQAFPNRATDSVSNSNHHSQVMEDGGIPRNSDPSGNIRAHDSVQAPSTDVEMDHPARRTGTKQALKEGIPTIASPPDLLLADQLENDLFEEVDLEAQHFSPSAATERPMQDQSRPSHLSPFSLLPHSSSELSPLPHSVRSSYPAPSTIDPNSELRGGGNRSDLQQAMSSSPTRPRSLPVAANTLPSLNYSSPQIQPSPPISPQDHRHSSEQESYNDDDNSLCDIRSHHRHPSHLDPSPHRHVISLGQYDANDNNNLIGRHLHPSSSTLVITTAGTRGSQTTSSLHSGATLKSQKSSKFLGGFIQKEQDRRPVSPSSHELSLHLPDPPDGGWKAWAVVLGSVMIQTFAFAPTEFIFGVFEQEYSLMFPGANPSSIALIGTIGTSSTYIVGFLAGICSDRWGYRVTACAGAIIMTLSLVLASFSTQVNNRQPSPSHAWFIHGLMNILMVSPL